MSDNIPKGFTEVAPNVFVGKGEVIVCGDPPDTEHIADDNDPRHHNCDAMGCGSLSHVVYRAKLEDPALTADHARLTVALQAAATPDQFWLYDDPETSFTEGDIQDMAEHVEVNGVAKVLTARGLPVMWVAHVATEYSDDFEQVEESEIQLFATEDEARKAVAVVPALPTEDTKR